MTHSVSLNTTPQSTAPTLVGDDILRLTALLLMFYGGSGWMLSLPLKIACGAALFSTVLLRNWWWWLGITVLIAFVNGGVWHSIDNHKYLISYWAICVTMAVAWPVQSRAVISYNAQLLIGTCFFFAVVWKLLAGQFLDGSFLHNVFLTDSRVAVPASIAGDVPLSELSVNRSLESMMQWSPSADAIVQLRSSPLLEGLAITASWWTLLIESLVAVLWLLPVRRVGIARDVALIVFIATTYFLLPVVGFATILGVMGYAVASVREQKRLKMVYLGVIAFMQLSSIPWGPYVSQLVTR